MFLFRYQSVYLRWMQCASLVNTIKPSLRKQRRKGYLFSTNLCFYAHFYRHAKLYLVYFLANFQTAGTSRRLGAPLVETPSSQFNRNTVYLTETGLIYDCVKVLMWKSLSCFYVCPCWNNDTVCFHCLKASRDKKDVFAQRDSACFGALIIRCPVASRDIQFHTDSNCPATSCSKSNSLSISWRGCLLIPITFSLFEWTEVVDHLDHPRGCVITGWGLSQLPAVFAYMWVRERHRKRKGWQREQSLEDQCWVVLLNPLYA